MKQPKWGLSGVGVVGLAAGLWVGNGAALGAVGEGGRYYLELRTSDGGASAAPSQAASAAKGDTAEGDESEAGGATSAAPLLVLEMQAGAWNPAVCGEFPAIPGVRTRGTVGRGLIRDAVRDGSNWRVTVDMLIGGMARKRDWLSADPPSRATWKLVFQAGGGGITGTWEGGEGGTPGAGALAGRVDEARDPGLPQVTAAQIGEHPRFLFRKEQLPELRRKAATPWGQAMLKRMQEPGWSRSGMAVARGLAYQVTGNAHYAEEARQLVWDDIRSGWWRAIGPIHDPAHKAVEAMLAYDLVYDTYDAAEHAQMREFLQDKMEFLQHFAEINSGNGHPHSNWSAQYQSGVGMVALMLLADPAELSAPSDWDFPKVSPSADYQVPEGVPVLPIDDASLSKWLYTGPLNIGLEADGLESLGGVAKARPVPGAPFKVRVKEKDREDEVSGKFPMAIQFKNARPRPRNKGVEGDDLQPLTKEMTASFQAIPESVLIAKNEYIERGLGAPGMVHLWRAAGCRSFQTLYFFAVIDNPRDQYMQVKFTNLGKNDDWKYHNSCVVVSGQRFEGSDVFFLEAGKHPVIRQVNVGILCEAHGRHHLYDEVWFRPLDEATATEARTMKNTQARFRRDAVEVLKPKVAELGKPNLEALWWLALARRSMERYATAAIGDRGWHCAGQCYTQHPMLTAQPFFHAYRNATGMDVTADQHLGWYLGQAAARTVFSDTWARMQDYGRGGGPVGVDVFGRGFANVPEAIRPAVLWAWKRTLDLTDRKMFHAPEGAVETLDPMSAAFTFVNYPGEPIPDAAFRTPGGIPNVVVDTQRLGYTMRNRWKDGDDTVAVFTGFRHPGGDWSSEDAPLDLRLQGMGAEWIVRGWTTNSTVDIPGVRAPEPEQAYHAGAPDGSAVTSLRYALPSSGKGLRSFAVDYSGAAGVPAVFVLVDDIHCTVPANLVAKPKPVKLPTLDGPPEEAVGLRDEADAGPLTWRLVTDASNEVTVAAGGFSIRAPNGAVLNATVVSPEKPKVVVEDVKHGYEINYRADHTGGTFMRKVVSCRGKDVFFVVLALGKGPVPAVKVTGTGRDAVVTVGKQTIRFDGEKIVLGTFGGGR